MCGSPPGTRCASDTRGVRQEKCNAYWDAHPDGTSIDPMSSADAQIIAAAYEVRRAQAAFDFAHAAHQYKVAAIALEERRAADALASVESGAARAATMDQWRAADIRAAGLRRELWAVESDATQARTDLERARAFALNGTSVREVLDESAANVRRAEDADARAVLEVSKVQEKITHVTFEQMMARQDLDRLSRGREVDGVVEKARQVEALGARIAEAEAQMPAVQAERARTQRELNRALGAFEADLEGSHDAPTRSSQYVEALKEHRETVRVWRDAEARLDAAGEGDDMEALTRATDVAYEQAQASRSVFERQQDPGKERQYLLRTAKRRLDQRRLDRLPELAEGRGGAFVKV